MAGLHLSPVALVIFAGLFGFALYRRLRRTVGRQPLAPGRLWLQAGLLAAAILLFTALASRTLPGLGAALLGLLAGGATGLIGLHHTRFERGPDRDYYTPNTYLGLGVFAVFLGRLVYRGIQVSASVQTLGAGGVPPAGFGGVTSTPLTTGLLLLMLGYYAVYVGGLLLWVRRNPPGREIHGGFRTPRPQH